MDKNVPFLRSNFGFNSMDVKIPFLTCDKQYEYRITGKTEKSGVKHSGLALHKYDIL